VREGRKFRKGGPEDKGFSKIRGHSRNLKRDEKVTWKGSKEKGNGWREEA